MSSNNQTPLSFISQLGALRDVESIIRSKLRSDAPLIGEVCEYLLSLGGKRIRPIMTFLIARIFGMPEPFRSSTKGSQLMEVAAGIELIHMATLLHDDIIDKSPLRRHKVSAYIKYGTDSTLLAGDFMLVRAFGLCAKLDSFIISETESACVALTEGEILETSLLQRQHSVASTLEVAKKKTAALFKLAAVSAAHLSGVPEEAIRDMAVFGDKIGTVFQIIDDILDVTSNEELLGKKAGQDLRERKPSIINVLWLDSGSPLARKLLLPPAADEEEFLRNALDELKLSPVIAQAKNLAKAYMNDARACLDKAFDLHARNIDERSRKVRLEALSELRQMLDYVMERVS